MSNIITVDNEKCVGCGICVECCPACILSMGENGPECNFEKGCMRCGHCVSICPKGALTNRYCPPAEETPEVKPIISKEEAYNFLRSRRSVRNFKSQAPTEAEITELLNMCRYAPSASNTQCIYFTVLRDRETIQKIGKAVIDWMEEEIANNTPNKRYFSVAVDSYKKRGHDIISRNAPCLVLMHSLFFNTSGPSTGFFAQCYAQLYAPTLGLASCVAGFIHACAESGYKPLLDIMQLPPRHNIIGVLMVGYPKYKFKRMPEKQHLKVEFR